MGTFSSSPTSSSSPYGSGRLGKRTIRLLTVKSIGGAIELETHRHVLTRFLNYDAMSYVWGNAPASVTVLCNNKPLLITPTVLEMLQCVCQHQTKRRNIWVDAICINQGDDEEKSTQIPLMRDIYSRAATVIVWMGPSTPETDVFFAEFQDTRKRSKAWIALYNTDYNCRDPIEEERPRNVDAFREAIRHLLEREWFTRLWTYQEIILPPKANLLCGESWTDFDEFLDLIIDGVFRSPYLSKIMDTERDARTNAAFGSCYSISTYRGTISQPERTNVIHSVNVAVSLVYLRYRLVKEPVDRVWAIVGLLESNLRDKVTPEVDYSEKGQQEYWKTWTMFAKALINVPSGISLLNVPPTLEPRSPYLPSWCPNFSGSSSCTMVIEGRWNIAIDEQPMLVRWALSEENGEVNSAIRYKAIVDHHERFTSTVKHDNLLRMQGFVLDTIEEIVEHKEVLDTGYGHYGEHSALQDLAVGRHIDSLDLARRVCYGKSDGVTDIPEDFIMALFTDHRITDRARGIYHETMPKLATWYLGSGVGASWEQAQCHQQWINMREHTFFSTRGGRIGFAHPGCKPGDHVATFYGGQPLYILRQVTPTNYDIYSTGEAYGHVQYMGTAFVPHLMEQHQRDAARVGPDTMFIIH